MSFDDLALLVPIFEIITLLLLLFNYKKIKGSTEKWFVYFLSYTVVTELIGAYIAYYLKLFDLTVYLIFMLVSFLFYFFWFSIILKSKKQQQIIKGLSFLFLSYGVYNLYLLPWDDYHYKTFILGSVINIIASIFFFSQLLMNKEEIEVQYNLKFWIATGLLLFNVGMVPFMLFSEEFDARSETRTIILVTLNFILYGCYSLGFILCKKPTEK